MDPGYPSHAGGVHLASGQMYTMPLLAQHGYLPQFEAIPDWVLEQAKLMVLSYPHNPTAALAPLSFWQDAVAFCQRHDLVLANDFPYADMTFIGKPAVSVLQADRQKTCSIEFFSMSKSYNMGGFRIGFAIGNAELIKALRQVKANVDFNQYRGIQQGAIAALRGHQDYVQQTIINFRQRRDAMVQAMERAGWSVPTPEATMYLWAKLPEPYRDSVQFCVDLVAATGVAMAPGRGFGKSGEGYVRIALVHPPAVLETAMERVAEFLQS